MRLSGARLRPPREDGRLGGRGDREITILVDPAGMNGSGDRVVPEPGRWSWREGGATQRLMRGASHPFARVVSRRVLFAVPLLFAVTALSFVLASLTPGDAAQAILGTQATPEQYAELRESLGLDLPLYQQYLDWLAAALRGDLGTSLISSEPVTGLLEPRLPVTLSLLAVTLAVIALVGVPMGVLSAVRGGHVGRLVDAFALVGFSLPAFWVGAALIALFSVRLGWLPTSGYTPVDESIGGWLRTLALPVTALAIGGVAAVAKQTREAMLDALASEYIRMARASGIAESSIVFRHALKNAAAPVVTVLGLQAIALLGGTIFVESVFALPGLGGTVATASLQHDLPVVQGVVVYFTIMVVLMNLVVDLLYTSLNPRVRTA